MTLSDLAKRDPAACMTLCERAALYYCAEAVRTGRYSSPFLAAVTVKQAQADAKRNGR